MCGKSVKNKKLLNFCIKGIRIWYKWLRKLKWIEKRQRWGSTKLQKILTKANRRNQRRRMYNAYMKLKRSVEKWHADQLRRRMVRKIIYLKKNRAKKICGLNFLFFFRFFLIKFIFIV